INYYFNSKRIFLYNISYLLDIKIFILYYFCSKEKKIYNLINFIYSVLYIYNLLIFIKPVTGFLKNIYNFIKIIK
ncbi:uncharacterized protein BO87DRAFT_322222, partial [Aspergillus neoniger CBS 115656]